MIEFYSHEQRLREELFDTEEKLKEYIRDSHLVTSFLVLLVEWLERIRHQQLIAGRQESAAASGEVCLALQTLFYSVFPKKYSHGE